MRTSRGHLRTTGTKKMGREIPPHFNHETTCQVQAKDQRSIQRSPSMSQLEAMLSLTTMSFEVAKT